MERTKPRTSGRVGPGQWLEASRHPEDDEADGETVEERAPPRFSERQAGRAIERAAKKETRDAPAEHQDAEGSDENQPNGPSQPSANPESDDEDARSDETGCGRADEPPRMALNDFERPSSHFFAAESDARSRGREAERDGGHEELRSQCEFGPLERALQTHNEVEGTCEAGQDRWPTAPEQRFDRDDLGGAHGLKCTDGPTVRRNCRRADEDIARSPHVGGDPLVRVADSDGELPLV